MLARRLAFLALSAATSLTAQYAYYLPQISDGVAANGSITTTLVVANVGKTVANVKITVTRDDSSAVPLTFSGLGSGITFTTRLPAGASRLFATDGKGDGSSGAAVITADAPLKVSAIVSNMSGSGDVLSECTAQAVPKEALAAEYMVPLDTTAGLDSGMALYNPGIATAQITLRLLDGSGVDVSSTTLTLRANGRVTLFGSRLAGVGSNFRGTLHVTSSVPLAGISVRQNASSPAYTLLPASSPLSGQIFSFLPRIEDGHSESGTTQTTFLLTNLSGKLASVEISITLDDGTPFPASIQGVLSDGRLKATIPPRATVFLQTDGISEELTSGAAKIVSDRPIGVEAVLTTSDASGAVVSETGVAPTPSGFQFLLPFDNSQNISAGASFFNTAQQDLNLTIDLLDADGKQLASTGLGPIAGGARVNRSVADIFSSPPATGAIRISTGGRPFLAALALRQSATGQVLSSGTALPLPWVPTGAPVPIRPTLDPARKASGSIGPAGGTLTVIDASGNRFTLTIPPNALVSQQTVVMTAIRSATGFSGPGFVAGVQLEPDGLLLFRPALLKFDLAAPLPAGVSPIGWRGSTPGIYLNAPLPDPKSLTLILHHFSGAGFGGGSLTEALVASASLIEMSMNVLADSFAKARQFELMGDEEAAAQYLADVPAAIIFLYESAVKPLVQMALDSDDADVMLCAYTHLQAVYRQLSIAGLAEDPPRGGVTGGRGFSEGELLSLEIEDYLNSLSQKRIEKLTAQCKKHDFTVFQDLLTAAHEAEVYGTSPFADYGVLSDTMQQCTPTLQLDYDSKMTYNLVSNLPNDTLTVDFDGTVHGSLIANGTFDKTSLTMIRDASKELVVSFNLAGAAKEKYDVAKYTASHVFSFPARSCTIKGTLVTAVPSTMTLTPRPSSQSRVQFMFDPQYNPAALTSGGQQLCSFCPVFRKKLVKVELYLDPGKPVETILVDGCGTTEKSEDTAWFGSWEIAHPLTLVDNWDLTDAPDLLARKTLTNTVTNNSVAGVKLVYTEKTDLKLKPCTGPIDTTNNTCAK